MSDIVKDLQVDLVITHMDAANKKQALEIIAAHMAQEIKCPQAMIYDRLMDKEKMASSGIGNGVAIPHMRILHMERPVTMLAKLATPITFKALDNKPVDVICTLISPRKDGPLHLRRLSRLTRMLGEENVLERIRESQDPDMIRSLMISPAGWLLAA